MVPAVELPPTLPPADHVTPVARKAGHCSPRTGWSRGLPHRRVFGETVMLCANRRGLASNAATVNLRAASFYGQRVNSFRDTPRGPTRTPPGSLGVGAIDFLAVKFPCCGTDGTKCYVPLPDQRKGGQDVAPVAIRLDLERPPSCRTRSCMPERPTPSRPASVLRSWSDCGRKPTPSSRTSNATASWVLRNETQHCFAPEWRCTLVKAS